MQFPAFFRAAAQDSELSGGPTPGVQLPTVMVLAAFPYGRTHEIPCFFEGVLIFICIRRPKLERERFSKRKEKILKLSPERHDSLINDLTLIYCELAMCKHMVASPKREALFRSATFRLHVPHPMLNQTACRPGSAALRRTKRPRTIPAHRAAPDASCDP